MPAPNLAEILSKVSDGLSVFDKDLDVTFVNEKAASILDADDEVFRKRLAQALKDHAPIRFDHFHASMSRWFEHQTYPNAVSRCSRETSLRATGSRMRCAPVKNDFAV
jgi:hypothetical protein